jgi:ferric-dicitrate binding protein FerR (iron transport regulator)
MTSKREYYYGLGLEELLLDNFFIESIKNPTAQNEIFWKEFIAEHPEKSELIEQASTLVKQLDFKKNLPREARKEAIWQNILSETQNTGKVISMKVRKTWIWAAASVIGLVLIAATALLMKNVSKASISTAYAEVKTVILPDSSIVMLNANSTIEYKKQWAKDMPREVWLNGEAFFDVKHINKQGQPIIISEKFIVHAGQTNIEVLGTTFNVVERKQVTSVVLQTGKVRVDFDNNKIASVVMSPGELIKFDQKTNRVIKEKALTDKYISWRKKEILLNTTTVSDIINIIENTFGYEVEVENKQMLTRQLSGTGTITLENEETLFKALELLLNVNIVKKDRKIIFKNK